MDAPWGEDFDAFIETAQSETLDFFEVVGNFNTLACQWMLQEFEIETNNIPVADREEMVAALAAGEGDFGCTQPIHAVQAEGRTVPIWMPTWTLNPYFEGIGSLNDHERYGADTLELGAQNSWFVHAGVPELHVKWLEALMIEAAKQPSYLDREETVPGLSINVLDNEAANAAARDAYVIMEPVIRAAGIHIDDR
jgi:tripartite-type tricarboxylate transporter receptor subunit TctC